MATIPPWQNMNNKERIAWLCGAMGAFATQLTNMETQLSGQMTTDRQHFDGQLTAASGHIQHIQTEIATIQTNLGVINGTTIQSLGLVQNLQPGQGPNPQGPNPQGPNPQGPNPQGPNPQGPNPQGGNQAPKFKMGTPEKFDGSDRSEAAKFMVACRLYVRTMLANETADSRITWIVSYLSGTALVWANQYFEQEIINNQNYPWLHDETLFWQEFQKRYGDANRKENFKVLIKKLRQTKTVQEFVTSFQTYASGLSYNEAALKDMFYDGLSENIRTTMLSQNFDADAHTYDEVVERALLIDRQQLSYNAHHKASHTSSPATSKSNTSTTKTTVVETKTKNERFNKGDRIYMTGPDGRALKGKILEIGKNNRGFVSPTVQWDGKTDKVQLGFRDLKKDNSPPKSDPNAMDLDSAGKGKTVGKCNNCGGKGHWAKDCPSGKMSGFEAELEQPSSDEESGKEDA